VKRQRGTQTMLDRASGVPFVLHGRWSGDGLPVGSRDRVRDPDRPLVPVTTCSYRGWAVPAAYVRTNLRTKRNERANLSPPGTISRVSSGDTRALLETRPNGAGRNAQPRGALSKHRSREHVCLIGPCVNIEPATQSLGAPPVGSRSRPHFRRMRPVEPTYTGRAGGAPR